MTALWFELADWIEATGPEARASLRARLRAVLPEVSEDRPSWWARAACRSADPSVSFFPLPGESATPAQAVCARCPSRRPCLDYALAQGAPLTGVWAGTTDADRAEMRRGAKAS